MSTSVQHVARTVAASAITKYVVADDQPMPVKIMGGTSGAAASSATRSDTFTVPANGTTVTSTSAPKQNFALQVNQTGTVDAWNVVVQTSLDGTNFTTVLTHTEATGTGVTVFVADKPALYYRSKLVSVTLGAGTNVVATILAMA